MRHMGVMAMVLIGAVALPAASMVSGLADFPRRDDAGLPILLVQSSDKPLPQSNPARSDPAAPPPPPGVSADAIGISPEATKAIVNAIKQGADFCQGLQDPRLNIDCLSDQYRFIAMSLPFKGGYAGLRVALFDAALKLHALAVDNYDGSPKTRPSKGGKTAHRYLAPVRNPAKVAIKATAIIEETRLVLLRSSSGSDQRRSAYEQVAAVVDSNKVLLRSA